MKAIRHARATTLFQVPWTVSCAIGRRFQPSYLKLPSEMEDRLLGREGLAPAVARDGLDAAVLQVHDLAAGAQDAHLVAEALGDGLEQDELAGVGVDAGPLGLDDVGRARRDEVVVEGAVAAAHAHQAVEV